MSRLCWVTLWPVLKGVSSRVNGVASQLLYLAKTWVVTVINSFRDPVNSVCRKVPRSSESLSPDSSFHKAPSRSIFAYHVPYHNTVRCTKFNITKVIMHDVSSNHKAPVNGIMRLACCGLCRRSLLDRTNKALGRQRKAVFESEKRGVF
jgi:hypothetical protein